MIKSLYRFLSPKFQKVYLEYKVSFKPRYGHETGKSHDRLYEITNRNRSEYKSRLESFLKYKEVFQSIQSSDLEKNENNPSWNNGFLPGLDIIAMYSIIAEFNPKRYIEVGSGNSTKVIRKSITENELQTKITSIDPFPRANIDHLADTIVRQPVENMDDLSVFDELESGDVFFIDNSHRCLPNSDVTVCFLEILPRLKKGVVVHIHDIYIPYDYPQFMCDRAYSEQYVLSAFVLANPDKYKIIMPNYFVSEDKELREILNPIWEHSNLEGVERHGGSFWIEIQ